jgi:type I restriction enzyme, S subunit
MALLEKHFDIAFDAPDGVQKLRGLILTLAMQGKLVSQDSGDQPAHELIEGIKAKEAKLLKQKAIKKPKPVAGISKEEAPYKIPTSWLWVRLGAIGEINPRNSLDDEKEAGFVPMPLIFSKYGKPHGFEKRQWSEIKKGFTHFANGDIGLAKITPCFENAKSCVFHNLPNGIGAGTTELHIFRDVFGTVFPQYLLAYLKNPRYIASNRLKMTGSAGQKRVPTDLFSNSVFPLPPLAEQRRIVAKIDQLMARCDELEKFRVERDRKQITVHTAALNRLLTAPDSDTFTKSWQFITQHFSELYTVKENVTELRKAILHLAVMGKLVPQNANDVPAKELLKELETERNKLVKEAKIKQTKLVLAEEDNPYELPKSWEWANLENLLAIVTDGDHQAPPRAEMGIPFLVIGNLNKGEITMNGCRFVPHTYYESLAWAKKPSKNDILYTVTGSYGIPIFVNSNNEFCVQRHVAILKSVKSSPIKYLTYFLRSEYAFRYATSIATGIAQKTVPLTGLRKMRVPVPPVNEQIRIVAKIDKLMALCDNLEQQIDTASHKQTALLNAVLA